MRLLRKLSIINLLKDNDLFVCCSGVAMLSEFSVHGMLSICSHMVSLTGIAAEFRGLIATSIPHIIDLLQDDDSDVSTASASALFKLSEHSM
jgi:HEAT repeat protein